MSKLLEMLSNLVGDLGQKFEEKMQTPISQDVPSILKYVGENMMNKGTY